MARRMVHKRQCPDCDGTLRIPVTYLDNAQGEDSRFEIDRGAQCSNQADGNHRVLADDELKELVRTE